MILARGAARAERRHFTPRGPQTDDWRCIADAAISSDTVSERHAFDFIGRRRGKALAGLSLFSEGAVKRAASRYNTADGRRL